MATQKKAVKHPLVDTHGETLLPETHHDDAKAEAGVEAPVPVPLGAVIDVVHASVRFGIGLTAMVIERFQKVAYDAIDRGAKIEKNGRKALSEFEHENVTYMKNYLKGMQAKSPMPNVAKNLEAHVEEALRTFDVPTKDDIRELHQHITAIGEKLDKHEKHGK